MVYETYSKRRKKLVGENDDVYVYDKFPKSFKVQVVHLWDIGLGDGSTNDSESTYEYIVKVLREEIGVFELPPVDEYRRLPRTARIELMSYFLDSTDPNDTLDVLELSCRVMDVAARKYYFKGLRGDIRVSKTLADLNIRFKEHAIGFQYTSGEIVRVDSELIHAEVVKPLLHLLNKPGFKGAEDEYLKAHEHYRHGNPKEAMAECLKAFESAMMGICKKRNWAYGEKDTAKTLIGICLNNNLVPSFWESQLTGLRSMLESGVPTGRNKLAGHGQGAEPVQVPMYVAGYVMHMTASTLKFLIEADESLG